MWLGGELESLAESAMIVTWLNEAGIARFVDRMIDYSQRDPSRCELDVFGSIQAAHMVRLDVTDNR